MPGGKLPPITDMADVPIAYTPGTINYLWCCDCGLRHSVIYDILDKGRQHYVTVYMERDDWATAAKRKLDRIEKSKKKRR
jgi:hypothetical protein